MEEELETEVYAEIAIKGNEDFSVKTRILPQNKEAFRNFLLKFRKNDTDKYCILNCECPNITIKNEEYFAESVTLDELLNGIDKIENDIKIVESNWNILNNIITKEVNDWEDFDDRFEDVINNCYFFEDEFIKYVFENYNKTFLFDKVSDTDRIFYLKDIIRDGMLLDMCSVDSLDYLFQDNSLKELVEKINKYKSS